MSLSPGDGLASSLRLGHEDAAIYHLYVVPRYLSMFGERIVSMLAAGKAARICHVHCRTGYPDRAILERMPDAHIHGCDPSESAIALAKAKAMALKGARPKTEPKRVLDYRVSEQLPLPFPAAAFSHAFTLHPVAAPAARNALFQELARVLAPRGQALVAMPLRGSFVEIADLLRECGLKHELGDLERAVDAAFQLRPTDEMFRRDLEAVGFTQVGVDMWPRTLRFESGHAFFEDPVTRLLLMPELRADLGFAARPSQTPAVSDGPAPATLDPFAYVRDAIDKYWGGRPFDLTIQLGVVTGRRR